MLGWLKNTVDEKPSARNKASLIAYIFAGIVVLLSYIWVQLQVSNLPTKVVKDRLDVQLPVAAQISLSFGDKHLAANLGVFRSLFLRFEGQDELTFKVLAAIHQDVARLNPAHEDSYYLAQSILPWVGHVDASDFVQKQAMKARRMDVLPPFFLGFNAMYFSHAFKTAGDYFFAASQLNPPNSGNREGLMVLAARMYAKKEDDPELAISVINGLKSHSKNPAFIAFLDQRIARLHGLIQLRDAAKRFFTQKHRNPTSLDELVSTHLIAAIPEDPTGLGYFLNENGLPALRTKN